MLRLDRILKRLPTIWRYRRELFHAMRDIASARVNTEGVVWVPLSALERRTTIASLRIVTSQQSRAAGVEWHDAALGVARRIELVDVATRGEVMAAERQRTSPMFV